MPGKLFDGRAKENAKNGVPQNSRGYCEGMLYRTTGTETTAPKSNNPHQTGSEIATAWDAGWDAAESVKGGTITRDIAGPCANSGLSVAADTP